MTLKDPEIHHTVRVALSAVEYADDDMTRNTTLSPVFIVPVDAVNGPLLMLYSPPAAVIGVCPLMPVMVTGADT